MTGFTSASLCSVFDFCRSLDQPICSANVFVFGYFNVRHKDWLNYSGGTDRPGELCYNFPTSNDLNQVVSFPNGITLTVLLLLSYFF